jgi:phosphoenolpyruvate carboxykinase (ATP)
MAGDRLEHAMIFYDIVKRNNIRCYLANTGTIGLREDKVALRQSLAAYNDLVRMQLRFSLEADHLGYHYPIKCDRANLDLMNAYRLFEDRTVLEKRLQDFYRGRREFLEEFEGRYGRIPEPIREALPYQYKDFLPGKSRASSSLSSVVVHPAPGKRSENTQKAQDGQKRKGHLHTFQK